MSKREPMLQSLISGFHFRARDHEGNRNPDDTMVLDLFRKNPETALSEVCGLENEKYPAVCQQASTLDANTLKSFRDHRSI